MRVRVAIAGANGQRGGTVCTVTNDGALPICSPTCVAVFEPGGEPEPCHTDTGVCIAP